MELEAGEVAAAEACSLLKEATTIQRLTFSRQIELLHHAASVGVPPLGHTFGLAVRTSLLPHLQGHAPPSLFGVSSTPTFIAGTAAIRSASPKNDAPQMDSPRPEEAI